MGVEGVVFNEAGEGDPAAEHVPLEGHERKGFGVGVHDERAGIDLHAAGEGKMDDRRRAGLQGWRRGEQFVARRAKNRRSCAFQAAITCAGERLTPGSATR